MKEAKLSPYHDWSDTNFDWVALDQAGQYLETQTRRWARLGIWTKEKYGTLRVSTTVAFALEYDFLHSLIYPGRCHISWPKWFRAYVDWPIGKLARWTGIIKLINKYQMWTLKRFWLKAAAKWPQVSEEILDEFGDYFE